MSTSGEHSANCYAGTALTGTERQPIGSKVQIAALEKLLGHLSTHWK